LQQAQSFVDEGATLRFVSAIMIGSAVLAAAASVVLLIARDSTPAVSPDYLPALPDDDAAGTTATGTTTPGLTASGTSRPRYW
jgi:hypothetical protein